MMKTFIVINPQNYAESKIFVWKRHIRDNKVVIEAPSKKISNIFKSQNAIEIGIRIDPKHQEKYILLESDSKNAERVLNILADLQEKGENLMEY